MLSNKEIVALQLLNTISLAMRAAHKIEVTTDVYSDLNQAILGENMDNKELLLMLQ